MAGRRLLTGRVWAVLSGATALSVLTGLLVWAGLASGCDGGFSLTVSTAPEITPAVREAARSWARRNPQVAGRCVRPTVRAADPARVAATISARAGADLRATGVEPDHSPLPDVWIPDSSTWITRVRAVHRDAVRPDTYPIAISAVVLALPVSAARAQGWPAARIGWRYVLGGLRRDPPLSVGLVEPTRSAVGLSALLLTGRLTGAATRSADPDARAAALDMYRALSLARTATTEGLRRRMASDDRVGAAFLTEREVHRHDTAHPDVPYAAVYPEPAAPALDYPYTTLAGRSPDEAEAAGRFRRWLGSGHARPVLTRHGFRTPDGAVGPDFPTGHGVSPEPVPPPRPVPAGAIGRALHLWSEADHS